MNKSFLIKLLYAVISLILTTFIIGSNFSFARQVEGIDAASAGDSSTSSGSSDINIDEAFGWTTEADDNVVDTTKSVMGTIIQVIRIVATGIAIIMLTYIAIKYMSAAPSDKADFKKSATGYIVGAVILFATSGILGVIQKFADTIG